MKTDEGVSDRAKRLGVRLFDMGRHLVEGADGVPFTAYVSLIEKACDGCGQVLGGFSKVDRKVVDLGGFEAREAEEGQFLDKLVAQFDEHRKECGR